MLASLASDGKGAISVGNASETGCGHGGWFIGPFLPVDAGIRRTDAVEVKWGRHSAGDSRAGLNDCLDTQSLAILLSGNFVVEFPTLGEEVVLSQAGDYVLYGPGMVHGWRAVESSTVLTVRWPAAE